VKSGNWLIALALLLLTGCGHKSPQIPSQRKGHAPEQDTAALAMMELNMRLAQAADNELARIASAQQEPYALYEANVWIHFTDRGDTEAPAPEGTCTLRMRTYALNGKLLTDTEGSYALGRNELPPGVEWNIGEMHPGAKARMYVPWYMAYGAQGTDHVPPYENVIMEIEIR